MEPRPTAGSGRPAAGCRASCSPASRIAPPRWQRPPRAASRRSGAGARRARDATGRALPGWRVRGGAACRLTPRRRASLISRSTGVLDEAARRDLVRVAGRRPEAAAVARPARSPRAAARGTRRSSPRGRAPSRCRAGVARAARPGGRGARASRPRRRSACRTIRPSSSATSSHAWSLATTARTCSAASVTLGGEPAARHSGEHLVDLVERGASRIGHAGGDLAREPRVRDDQVAVRGSVRPPLSRCSQASTNGVTAWPWTPAGVGRGERLLDQRLDVVEALVRRAAEQQAAAAELPVRRRDPRRLVRRLDARRHRRPAARGVEERQRVGAQAEHRARRASRAARPSRARRAATSRPTRRRAPASRRARRGRPRRRAASASRGARRRARPSP